MTAIESDLGLHLATKVRPNSTLTLTHVPLLRIARVDAAQFTQFLNLELDRSYSASFDFDMRTMEELLRLLPASLAESMAHAIAVPFAEPYVLDLADHALAIDMRVHIGPLQASDDEQFAPFVVESFAPDSGAWGIVMAEPAVEVPSPAQGEGPTASAVEPPVAMAAKRRRGRGLKPFLEAEREEQESWVWQALFLQGALEKDTAVRTAAQIFRENDMAEFQRLDSAGELYGAILKAIERNVGDGSMDRPQRGYVRTCVESLEQLDRSHWQTLLVAALEDGPVAREDAVRRVAEQARLVVNLPFTRLREDGRIAQAIRSAINGALRRSLILEERGMLSVAPADEPEFAPEDAAAVDREVPAPATPEPPARVAARVSESKPAASAMRERAPLMAFSWGYYGWGSHTPELLEMVDLVEASRGFGPPRFVDVRLRRQVRATGFRERAFEKLAGPDRHTWLPGLGNRMIADRDLEEQELDDPAATNDLLALITASAAENRRVIFFCACKSPHERHTCHRGLVAKTLLETSRARKVPLVVQEWPGGVPVIATVDIPEEQMAKLLKASRGVGEVTRLPLPAGVPLAAAAALPHESLLRCRRGDDEVLAAAGPIIRTIHGWVFPVYAVLEKERLKPSLLKQIQEDFLGHELGPMGAVAKRLPMWAPIDLATKP